jgi:hypothetical protein
MQHVSIDGGGCADGRNGTGRRCFFVAARDFFLAEQNLSAFDYGSAALARWNAYVV